MKLLGSFRPHLPRSEIGYWLVIASAALVAAMVFAALLFAAVEVFAAWKDAP